jgi:hypothetical protein
MQQVCSLLTLTLTVTTVVTKWCRNVPHWHPNRLLLVAVLEVRFLSEPDPDDPVLKATARPYPVHRINFAQCLCAAGSLSG